MMINSYKDDDGNDGMLWKRFFVCLFIYIFTYSFYNLISTFFKPTSFYLISFYVLFILFVLYFCFLFCFYVFFV